MKNAILVLVSILVLWNCQSNSSRGEKETALAKDLCKCMQPLVEINGKAESAMQQGRMEEVRTLFVQIEQISGQVEACQKNLEIKYGIIEGDKEANAHETMYDYCSEVAKMIARKKVLEK